MIDMFKNSDKNVSELAIDLQYLLLQLLFIFFCFVSSVVTHVLLLT